MSDFQQVLDGGIGAMTFYLLFTGVNIVKSLVTGKGKADKLICLEHGAMCVHLETIRSDVGEIKGNVNQLVRDVAELQGRIEA
jgi:hypothetical protein